MSSETFSDEEFYECMDKASETANFYTVFIIRNWLAKMTKKDLRSGLPSLNTLEENLITVYEGCAFKRYSPFYEEFNEKIGRMLASGLIDYWFSNYVPGWREKNVGEEIGPQVLTMEHVETGFYVCMVPLVLAVIVFLIEIIYPWLKNLLIKYMLVMLIKNFIKNSSRHI